MKKALRIYLIIGLLWSVYFPETSGAGLQKPSGHFLHPFPRHGLQCMPVSYRLSGSFAIIDPVGSEKKQV